MKMPLGRPSLLRLMNEHKSLTEGAPQGITAGPVDDKDYYDWEATMMGPTDTPFEDGIFKLRISFPK